MGLLNRISGYASLLMAAVMLLSCSGSNDDAAVTGKKLVISADKKFVQTFGGDYVGLTVTLNGEVMTEGVTFYDENDDMIDVEDFKFAPEEAGDYTIYANYGTYFTDEPVEVTALAVAIPDVETGGEELGFKPRVLLTQFTTTGCVYCPLMKTYLKEALVDSYVDKVVKVDCHNLVINKRSDPAYVYLPKWSYNMPTVLFDNYVNVTNGSAGPTRDICETIDALYDYKSGNAAGIAVGSAMADGQIVTKVVVKAAEEGDYRVGVMLLEDNIVAKSHQTQLGDGAADWMNTHNSCIRYMDAGADYSGHSLGHLERGAEADYVFVFNLQDIWRQGNTRAEQAGCSWSDCNEDKLHLAVFVTTIGKDERNNEFLYVSNVVDCPVDGTTPFQYLN